MADNPSWQPILEALPADLHPLIKPKLEEWDRNVNAKFDEIRGQYQGFDEFKDVNPQYVKQALQVAQMIRDDPGSLVERLNTQMGLGYLTKEEAEALAVQQQQLDPDDLNFDGVDITQHPEFVAMKQALEGLNSNFQERLTKEQEAEQAKEFEQYMATLHETEGDFDDEYVMAIMAHTDLDGPSAVAKYREKIASLGVIPANEQPGQANNGTPPPVVLDGNGRSSGAEVEPIDFGNMSKSATVDFVAERLRQAAEANQ